MFVNKCSGWDFWSSHVAAILTLSLSCSLGDSMCTNAHGFDKTFRWYLQCTTLRASVFRQMSCTHVVIGWKLGCTEYTLLLQQTNLFHSERRLNWRLINELNTWKICIFFPYSNIFILIHLFHFFLYICFSLKRMMTLSFLFIALLINWNYIFFSLLINIFSYFGRLIYIIIEKNSSHSKIRSCFWLP